MSKREDNFPEDLAGVLEEIVNDALWGDYYSGGGGMAMPYHFAPEGTHFVFPDNFFSDKEAYDVFEDGDNVSWEEYLREQDLG